MACNCIELVNEKIAEHNTVLDTDLSLNMETGATAVVLTAKVAKLDPKNRKRPMPIVFSFCPFCGRDYREPRPAATAEQGGEG